MTLLFNKDQLLAEIKNYKTQLKYAKKIKAEIAVQFKHAENGSTSHAALIEKMQACSTEIKGIEANLKITEKKLLEIESNDVKQDIQAAQPPLLNIDPTSIWKDSYSIRELNTPELNDWHEYVAQARISTAYHQAAWHSVIEKSFDKTTRVWAAFDEKNVIIGGIPLTFFSSALFGKFAVSIPYLNYGGVLTNYFNIAQELLAILPALCSSEQLSHIEVRTMQSGLADGGSSKKASMILPLPKTKEQLDTDLGSKIRAQIKKCTEHTPNIRFGKLELLNDFYKVFATNMRDLGTPVYSKDWFENILRHPDIDATLAVVYINNNPVSTGFLVGFNRMLEIPWASTIKEANALNANMWMYRNILDFAIERQYKFFDFGRSTQDAGTYKFKKQWGSHPYIHHWYKILPAGSDAAPELNPDNPKFALMIAVWKRIPVWVTKIIGPLIIRNIP